MSARPTPPTASLLALPPEATANLRPGQKPRAQTLWKRGTDDVNIIRDQLTFAQWMLAGAALQALLLLVLPLSRNVIATPVLALATWKILRAILAVSSYRPGRNDPYIRRAKVAATFEDDAKSDGGVCILILGVRSYHPLGILAPGFMHVAEYMGSMCDDLEGNSQEYGFLGFKTEGWDWWNKTLKEHSHIGIFQETYHSPAGHWEAAYSNFGPHGLRATVFPNMTPEGEQTWRTPTKDALRGRLRTSQGRMRRTNGEDNDHLVQPTSGLYTPEDVTRIGEY